MYYNIFVSFEIVVLFDDIYIFFLRLLKVICYLGKLLFILIEIIVVRGFFFDYLLSLEEEKRVFLEI